MANLTISLAGITSGNGRTSARVDNSTNLKRAITFRVRIETNTAPTAGDYFKFFFHRQDAEATAHSDDSVGSSDAGISVEPDISQIAGYMIVTNSGSTPFETSFTIYDPGLYWSLSFWNGTDQTISNTGGDHYVRYDYLD